MKVIEMTNLKRIFKQNTLEVHALRGLDLAIEYKEFTAIAGPSGSGKTTLMNIVGLLDLPTEGEVLLEGRVVKNLSEKEKSKIRLNRIGFIFQSYNLIPVLSAFENVEYPLILQKQPKSARKKKVTEMLNLVGLSDCMHRRPSELSGGQQQRAAVARSLVTNPAIVLADEPTANLDSENALKLLEIMKNLNDQLDTTFLFSSHDPRVFEKASRIIWLRDGKIHRDEIKN